MTQKNHPFVSDPNVDPDAQRCDECDRPATAHAPADEKERWFKQQYGDPQGSGLPPMREAERVLRGFMLLLFLFGVVIGALAGFGMAYTLGLYR